MHLIKSERRRNQRYPGFHNGYVDSCKVTKLISQETTCVLGLGSWLRGEEREPAHPLAVRKGDTNERYAFDHWPLNSGPLKSCTRTPHQNHLSRLYPNMLPGSAQNQTNQNLQGWRVSKNFFIFLSDSAIQPGFGLLDQPTVVTEMCRLHAFGPKDFSQPPTTGPKHLLLVVSLLGLRQHVSNVTWLWGCLSRCLIYLLYHESEEGQKGWSQGGETFWKDREVGSQQQQLKDSRPPRQARREQKMDKYFR